MKCRILIHESAVRDQEMNNFLKGIKNAEFTFVTSYKINDEHITELYKKYGSQIDNIKAKVRTSNVFPPFFQDIAIFGGIEVVRGYEYSKKSPDTKVFIVPEPGEFTSDIGSEGNLQGAHWQFIHEYIAIKTESEVNKPKEKHGKPKRKNPSNIIGAVAPATERRDEWDNDGGDGAEESDYDARYD